MIAGALKAKCHANHRESRLSIDRINNESRNCRWATHSEQMAIGARLDQAKFEIMAVATKRIIFFGTKSEKGRSRFHPPGPETFAMVDGRKVAAVNGQDEARRARSLAGRLRRPSRLHSRKPRASAGPAVLGRGHER